jgi:hypothetical protein
VKFWLSLLFEPTEQLLDLPGSPRSSVSRVSLPDHVVVKVGDKTPHPSGYPLQPDEDFIDPFCAFAAMSAVTTRLRFMNYVYVVRSVIPSSSPAVACPPCCRTTG